MTNLLSIGTKRHIDSLRDQLTHDLYLLRVEGIHVNCGEKQSGEFTFINCQQSGAPGEHYLAGHDQRLRCRVAQTLSDLIVNHWEERMVDRIIRNDYCDFSREERTDIGTRARSILDGEEKGRFDGNPGTGTRRASILRRLKEYMERTDYLNLEGFINFRLKDYLGQLEEAVEQAVDEYLVEKEHHEFVRLLRYFVETQQPRVEKIQVVLRSTGFFQLFDGAENAIKNDTLEGFVVDVAESSINQEDVLLSALITMAPGQVVLHIPYPEKVSATINTLQGIFGERLSTCSGCDRCGYPAQTGLDQTPQT